MAKFKKADINLDPSTGLSGVMKQMGQNIMDNTGLGFLAKMVKADAGKVDFMSRTNSNNDISVEDSDTSSSQQPGGKKKWEREDVSLSDMYYQDDGTNDLYGDDFDTSQKIMKERKSGKPTPAAELSASKRISLGLPLSAGDLGEAPGLGGSPTLPDKAEPGQASVYNGGMLRRIVDGLPAAGVGYADALTESQAGRGLGVLAAPDTTPVSPPRQPPAKLVEPPAVSTPYSKADELNGEPTPTPLPLDDQPQQSRTRTIHMPGMDRELQPLGAARGQRLSSEVRSVVDSIYGKNKIRTQQQLRDAGGI